VAVLLATLQQATAIPYAIPLGNVSVQTEIPALMNGFQVEVTQHGDSQLPSFAFPLDVAGTSPSQEVIRQLLPQDVAACGPGGLQTGLWPVNGKAWVFFEQGPSTFLAP